MPRHLLHEARWICLFKIKEYFNVEDDNEDFWSDTDYTPDAMNIPLHRAFRRTHFSGIESTGRTLGGECNGRLVVQVGASNELPESEELDALYDRFLVRRQVAQVSSSQLPALARLAAKLKIQQPEEIAETSNGSSTPAPTATTPLTLDDFK